MAIVRKKIDVSEPLTQEEVEMLRKAAAMPAVFDEDSPELTDDQLKEFRRVSEANREDRVKPTVAIRLSPQAYKKAKSLGKGYTSVLARILEAALSNNDTIRQYL